MQVYLYLLIFLSSSTAANYTLTDEFSHESFFEDFQFYNSTDPSHGFVQYVDYDSAVEKGYIELIKSGSKHLEAYLGVDRENITPLGRPSVRITSRKSWNHGLVVADISAVPTGCGLWPALWMVNPSSWPEAGEIDIYEAVHNSAINTMTLHTSSGCSVSNSTEVFSGKMTTSDCDVYATGQAPNAGCSISALQNSNTTDDMFHTAGSEFNHERGGMYVMEWTSSSISIFFFPRRHIPADLAKGVPNPSAWGHSPLARFAGPGCNLDQHVANLSLVINTDFCGDWGESTWESSGCATQTGKNSCATYVANVPQAFSQAFWQIDSVKVYQKHNEATRPA